MLKRVLLSRTYVRELVFLETTANDIKITRTDISHLDLKPHPDALKWKWENDR